MDPSQTWTLPAAREQLAEVVRRALDHGPQTVAVAPHEAVVVVSKAFYDTLRPPLAARPFQNHLLAMPKVGLDVEP